MRTYRSTETCRWYGGPICNRCHGKAYRISNSGYHKEFQRKYNQQPAKRNSDRLRSRLYYKNNKIKIIEYEAKYQSNKLKTDILFKLKRNLRSRLNKAVQFGYKTGSIEGFRKHLESKFQPGMTWNNYGQ